MNTNEPEKTIDLCLLTDHFVRRATETGIQPEAIFFSLDRQISTNPFAKKICFIQPENLNLAPVLLQHGISAVPSQNSELQLLMEALLLHENEGKNRSILISECPAQMADLLRVMRQAQIHVNVLSVTECPRLYEAWVESWTNVAPEVQTVSDETDSEPEEEVCKASEIIPEPEPVVEMTQALEVPEEIPAVPEVVPESEPEIQPEAQCAPKDELPAISQPIAEPIVEPIVEQEPTLKEEPELLPKAKKEREITLQEKAKDIASWLASKNQMFSFANDSVMIPKMNLNSKESAANPSQIVKYLALAFQWLGNLLGEANNKKRIVECTGYILKLCGMAEQIPGLELSKTRIECQNFIEKEILPKWPIAELQSSKVVNLEELPQIGKKLSNQFKKAGGQELELVVWNRLEKSVRNVKNVRKLEQDSLNRLQNDVYKLVNDFNVLPENEKLCNLIQQIQPKLTEKLVISDEMSWILHEIDAKKIGKEQANCSETELNDKYQTDRNILKIREFLRNKILVVVGGTPRKEQKECFEKAFQCEIDWEETDHGQSLDRFSAVIKNEKVGALLTLQNKASHKHSQELYTMAKKAGKKLFRVAHMNPIVVAREMMKQHSNNIQ